MDAIRNAIAKMHYKIPKQVLEKVFISPQTSLWGLQGLSVDKQIEDLVVRPRVLVDCNLVGGQMMLVDLNGLPQQSPQQGSTIIRIPKTRTSGRAIISVLNVSFLSATQLGTWFGGGSYAGMGQLQSSDGGMLATLEAGIMRANDKIPVTSTSNVSLVSENVIRIADLILTPGNMVLRCIVENDSNLGNISPRSYHAFEKLVELAVKSYIYNSSVVLMDQAQLQGGFELGVLKSIIEGYSDAEQNYSDYLDETWKKIAYMNDRERYSRLIDINTGAYR